MRSTIFGIAAIAAAAIFACGGNSPDPNAPTSGADAGAMTTPATPDTSAAMTPPPAADAGGATASTDKPAAPAGGVDFDTLPKDKKLDIMMTKVVPDVGKVFKDHDAKKYAKFGCKTCHGDAKEKSKDDPKKVLPKLTLSGGGFEKLQKAKPDVVKWMSEGVVPAMATALGEQPYDMKTHQGFGCAGCHTVN